MECFEFIFLFVCVIFLSVSLTFTWIECCHATPAFISCNHQLLRVFLWQRFISTFSVIHTNIGIGERERKEKKTSSSRALYNISCTFWSESIQWKWILVSNTKNVQCKLLVRFMGKLNDITLAIPTFYFLGSIILINSFRFFFVRFYNQFLCAQFMANEKQIEIFKRDDASNCFYSLQLLVKCAVETTSIWTWSPRNFFFFFCCSNKTIPFSIDFCCVAILFTSNKKLREENYYK